ncbi:MAG: transposase [Gordonibacter sp.]
MGGLRGRGTDKALFIVVAQRARGGKLAIRATADCSGASYEELGKWRISKSTYIRADGWRGACGGLKAWPELDREVFDADDGDASLPLAHHVISNFKSHIQGTYHGIMQDRLQAYVNEFCWRYDHLGTKEKFGLLLADLCRRAKRERRRIPLMPISQIAPTNKAA